MPGMQENSARLPIASRMEITYFSVNLFSLYIVRCCSAYVRHHQRAKQLKNITMISVFQQRMQMSHKRVFSHTRRMYKRVTIYPIPETKQGTSKVWIAVAFTSYRVERDAVRL